jgi:hypothetical protein
MQAVIIKNAQIELVSNFLCVCVRTHTNDVAVKFPEWFYCATWSWWKYVCGCFNVHQLRFQWINASYVEDMAFIRRVFLRLVAKMSDCFLEQWINIKFCVKLGKNESDTCAVLSEALKTSSVFWVA